MKVLITGSSGMLGCELCVVLGTGHETVGMDVTGPQTTDHSPQRFYECSITDAARVREIIEKEKPGLVIHAAAWTDVDGCELDPEKDCGWELIYMRLKSRGRLDKLKEYCLQDVKVTKQLYEHGRMHGVVSYYDRFKNEKINVPVNFMPQKIVKPAMNLSLGF